MNDAMTNPKLAQSGFSMVEVLITVFIVAIGLLGLASMQSAGIRQAMNSQSDTQVQLLGQDLAEMIIAYDSNGNGDYAFADVPNAMGTDCGAQACTRTQLATYNVFQWKESIDIDLPELDLEIVFNAATTSYEIRMTWDSQREGESYNAPTCTVADSAKAGCFAMALGL